MTTIASKRSVLQIPAAFVLAALFLCARPVSAQVQFQVEFAPPPAEWVATSEPVYFEGHPAYWYNGHWHYRDERGAWRFYRDEPGFLAERRMHAEPARRYYEHREERREEHHEERREEHRR